MKKGSLMRKNLKPINQRVKHLICQLGLKDEETKIHSCKVAQIAYFLGKKNGIEDEYSLNKLRLSSLLHDIGKIRIPHEILKKEGKLTDEEYEIIKKHSKFGEEIISHFIPELDSKLVLEHHERYDGHGYPNGKKNDEISFEASICSVADTFDAIISGRFYQEKKNLSETLKEMDRCSSRYNPLILKSLFKNAEKIMKKVYKNP